MVEIINKKYPTADSVPDEKIFPYKHNYDAVLGRNGWGSWGKPGSQGGHSIDDDTTQFDTRGVPYKPETEEAREERFFRWIEEQQKREQAFKKGVLGVGEKIKSYFRKIPVLNKFSDPKPKGYGWNRTWDWFLSKWVWNKDIQARQSTRVHSFIKKDSKIPSKALKEFQRMNAKRLQKSKDEVKFIEKWKKDPDFAIKNYMKWFDGTVMGGKDQKAKQKMAEVQEKVWNKK